MTTSPSELAEHIAGIVGSESWSDDHGTPKVFVDPSAWVSAHEALTERMPYFSWLSAIDWTTEVAVGDPPDDEDVEERFEVLSCLGNAPGGEFVILSTSVGKEDPVLDTVSEVYGGANWHEREAAEMFGIEFAGHPNLSHLYLPDGFEGNPLRKTFPLLSREVKPWPGTVDVEDMPEEADDSPSTENPEDSG